MSNTITKLISGLLGSENFAGQVDGANATSTYFTITGPTGFEWKVATLGGKKCMRSVAGATYDYFSHGASKILDGSPLVAQRAMFAPNWGSDWHNCNYVGSEGSSVYRAVLDRSLYAAGGFADARVVEAARAYYPQAGNLVINQWYYAKDIFDNTNQRHLFYLTDKTLRVNWKANGAGAGRNLPTGNGAKGFYVQCNNDNCALTDLMFCKGDILTVSGIVAGMGILILDSADNKITSEIASGTSVAFEFSEVLYPLVCKIKVIGTDGTTMLETSLLNIYGGDVYNYSGDHSTPPPVPPPIVTTIEMRSEYSSMLKHYCHIYRQATTKQPTGEIVETWTAFATDVQCLIQPMAGKQVLEFRGLGLNATYKGFFLYDQDIKLRDKIIFGNKNFYVSFIEKEWSGEEHHKEVYLDLEELTDVL